jgi:putative effector of murein hydrolase LrgA (UPF0299 family)
MLAKNYCFAVVETCVAQFAWCMYQLGSSVCYRVLYVIFVATMLVLPLKYVCKRITWVAVCLAVLFVPAGLAATTLAPLLKRACKHISWVATVAND